jgi:hypothetical protein
VPMGEDEIAYADRARGHSLNVMVVCGPNKEFYDVFADFPGRAHDTRVLRQSPMFRRMQNGPRKVRFVNYEILKCSTAAEWCDIGG